MVIPEVAAAPSSRPSLSKPRSLTSVEPKRRLCCRLSHFKRGIPAFLRPSRMRIRIRTTDELVDYFAGVAVRPWARS